MYIFIRVVTHMDYLFPIGNENLFSSVQIYYIIHISFCLLNFQYLFIMTKIVSILVIYIVMKMNNPSQFEFMYSSQFLLNGTGSFSRLLIYYLDLASNHMQ